MKAWNYLSGWTNSFSLPSNIQKKLYKFLLKRAIGPFLENDLDLDNFDIELVNGSVELRELKLNLNKLNELLQDSCFMVEKGHVSSIHASLPWANHWSGVSIKIQGLELNLVPVKHKEQQHHRKPDISIEGSIMSSSLHFADDFLKSEVKQPDEQEDIQSQGDGIYILTRTIDKLFAQLRVDIIDTMIHIVHKSDAPLSPDSNNTCYSLDISIPRIAYFDETPEFNNNNHATNTIDESSVIVPNETIKIITISSPTVWLRSAPIIISEQSDVFYDANPYEALIFTTMDKSNWIRIKTIPYNENAFHIKQVDFLLTHSRIIITPSQFAFFMDLLNFTQQDQPPPTNTDILGDLDMRNQKHYTTIHSDNDAFERKIKIQISLIECFILHQHPSDNVSILDQDLVDLNQGHIRLTMDQLNIRIQQFSSHDQCVNIRLSDLTLDEWIETNHGLRCQPMIQFDDSIKTSYSHQDLFPSFYDTEQSFERSPVEVIRIKLDNKRGNISVDDDIYVDIQAFKLLVDPRTVDRLEQYVLAILNRSPSTSEVPTNTKLRIKCAFIRLILLSPDMSQATSR
ncbi:Autophagy protein, partial [Rhizopus azygosporus]